jgi:hydroxypyruvate isomerase
MPAIAQSASWWCFVPERLTPEEFVRSAADAGYLALDLVPPEHFSLVTDHGLKIAAVAGHESLTVGLNKRDQHARIKKEIEAKLADAVRHGIPNLICFPEIETGWETLRASMSWQRIGPISSVGRTRRSHAYLGATE